MRTGLRFVLLAGLATAWLAFPVESPIAGTIVGKVTLTGDYALAGKAAMDADGLIRAQRSVVVSQKGGLANAVIYLKDVPGDFPAPSTPAELDQKEKTYVPHVLPILQGQKVDIANTDGILHNVHAYAGDDTVFNLAMPPYRKHATMEISTDHVVMIACDVHHHMRAWIFPVDNPFFSVSRQSGLFSIEGVPAGTYTIEAWHEVFGALQQTVTVKEGTAKTPVLFKFQAR
ncbi:MAG: hypothetical protein ACE5HD_06140 [Acidobacteriota bacterium]